MKKALIVSITLIAFIFTAGMSYAQQGTIDNNTNTGAAAIGIDNTSQGQGQGQGQSINTTDNSTNTNEAQDRNFPIPGGVNFGPVINYYGKPLPGAQFRPVESLLMYANIFSEGALESIIKRGKDADLIVDLNVVRDRNVQIRAKYEEDETRWIKIVATTKMLPEHGLIGYITSEGDDRKTDMMEVIAGAALAALQEGADVLQIVAQGAARDTVTSGWGIGFNTTQAMITGGGVGSGADSGANISSGGTGYSSAWAGMRDKPWLQANALKSPTKVIGAQMAKAETIPAKAKVTGDTAPAPKEDGQTGNHKSSGSSQDS